MTENRIEKIQAMLAEEPHDVFLRYSLALEQEKIGQHDASEAGLRSLMAENPPYVPASSEITNSVTVQSEVM